MNRVFHLFLIIFSIPASALLAQKAEKFHLDQPSPEFRDGLYANIEMVKNNNPIPAGWIETDMDPEDRNFYKNITRTDLLVFYDDNGVRSYLNTGSIWGYASRGDLYINVGGGFHKIDFVGRISHFIASKTTYAPMKYLDHPDIWYSPLYVLTLKYREYLVDIEENKVWEFDMEGIERVLKNDPQLLSEFENLKKREKEKMKYTFLLRYNQKYPLDIHF